jgi:hypothetical protein
MGTDGKAGGGKANGGLARAEVLSPERRREIAAKAAAARWAASKPLRATHRGNFEQDFGIDIECYVVDDEQKSAVISQRGMAAALGLGGTSGRALPRFVAGRNIAPYVGAELVEKLENPLIFQWSGPVSNVPPAVVYGYDVTLLIDICKAINAASADGVLLQRQQHIARQAQVIVNASAKAGIKNLVYALVGYDASREEIISAFKLFVRNEAREYEKEFPPELYKEWYRLYQLPKPARNKPWKFAHLTLQHIYTPLARSNGKILELTRAERDRSPDRHKKLHQFLSDIGVKALRTHLGQLLGIAQVSDDRRSYERHVQRIFGQQLALAIEEE